MRFLVALTILLVTALAMPAIACSPPRSEHSPAALDVAKEILASQDRRFVGKVEIVEFEPLVPGQKIDFKITYKVLKQYVGAPKSEISVVARGNTCVFYKPYIGQTDLIDVNLTDSEELPLLSEGFPAVSDEDLEKAFDELTFRKMNDDQ